MVRVSANVNVYDGPRLPLAWCPTDDLADYRDVRDDQCWVCEVLPEDLPYDVVVEAIQKLSQQFEQTDRCDRRVTVWPAVTSLSQL